ELSPAGEEARARVDQLHTLPLRQLLDEGRIQTRFDLILMSHVLEHLTDPAAELRAMTRVLNDGGHIFLETPNLSGNRRLPIDDNRSHLHFFSATSMTRLLSREGLETIAAATDVRLDDRYADSLQVLARPFHLPTWSPTFLSDHPALAGEDDIIVWGAGSLADEVLANFFDPARIAFFIDQNPSKQGTTCLGRPVCAPNALKGEPRTILINSIDFAKAISAHIETVSPNTAHRLVRIGDLL
ncbi:MAG: class I SAM-dependent methyltransferase, partial [Caulobacteraceae bacterium]